MGYTGQTPIIGLGESTAAMINAWFVERGPGGAAYCGLPYQPPPPNLGELILEEAKRWPPHLVNHDLIAGDIAHESAFWQSKIVREKNNPSGLGAENDDPYNKAATFPSPREGIRATVAHMLTYAVGDGPWRDSDPRFSAVQSAGWLGVVDVLDDLNGKWAYPGTKYGAMVAASANALLLIDDATSPTLPTKPPIRVSIIPKGNPNRPGGKLIPGLEYLTIHETGNTAASANAEMHRLFTHNGGGKDNVSFHWVVDDHEAIQLLPSDELAWHAGDGCDDPTVDKGCYASNAIETCVNKGSNWAQTKENLADLLVSLMRQHGIPIQNVVQHNKWSGKNCPTVMRANGNLQWNELIANVQGKLSIVDPPPLPGVETRTFKEVPWQIVYGFKGFWEELEMDGTVWRTLGFPTGNEIEILTIPSIVTAQPFERGWLIWQPDETPDVTMAIREFQHQLEPFAGLAATTGV